MENESQASGERLLDGETTALLKQWSDGDESAFEKVKKRVDAELRRLAARYLNSDEKNARILQPTVIVQDFYIRLLQLEKEAGARKIYSWNNRAHFIGFAAETMRQILIDYIRKELAAKRDGGKQVTLDESGGQNSGMSFEEISEIHDILNELKKFKPLWAQIVVLRFFGGFGFEEIARILEISESTARRHYENARKWIYERMNG